MLLGRTARMMAAVMAALAGSADGVAAAPSAFSCGGFAQGGGAQLLCSHTDPTAPAQICTFSWSLATLDGGGPSVAQGSFLLAPGTINATVFQGSGFAYALTNPVVLCQGSRAAP